MDNLPVYIGIVFGLTTILSGYIFYKATVQSRNTGVVLFSWLIFQAGLGLAGFYTITDTMPPRFLLLVLPPLLLIIFLFNNARGVEFIDSLDIKTLTILHTIRIPVEVVLYCLFVNRTVPELMTFSGRNWDVVSGVTAPFIFYLGFIRSRLGNKFLLFWNFICLMLLFNIVIIGILSAPFPFQQFAFDQPNKAVLYFPFNWLPGFVVPLVLFSHLAIIRQLFYNRVGVKS
jgi:hypothetical protein